MDTRAVLGIFQPIEEQVYGTRTIKKANYFVKMEKQILTLVDNNELKFPFN